MGSPVFLYAKARTKKLCVLFCVPSPEGGVSCIPVRGACAGIHEVSVPVRGCKLQWKNTVKRDCRQCGFRPRKGCKLQYGAEKAEQKERRFRPREGCKLQ